MQGKSRARTGVFVACLTALMFVLPTLAIPASARARTNATHAIRPILPSPEKDAAIVVDGATGKVLYARNPDAIRYPASLTKMMTLYLLFEALDKGTITLDTPMIASTHATEQEPTKLYVPLGGSIAVDTAIKAITVLSANDVAVVIAEALGGGSESTFASMMTEKAHELGMTHTNFHNASGLPDLQQLSTARDLALLGRHLAYDFPQYYHYFSVPSFTYNGRVYGSHDNLLTAFEGTDGIKTGYTQLSGFNLVTSAVRDNKHVMGVVMGGPTAAVRDREMMRLLAAAFQVARQDPTILAEANVPWKGGKGPGGDLFKADPGEDDVLLAALETKGNKKNAPVLVAEAKQAPAETNPEQPILVAMPAAKPANPATQTAVITPVLQPAPAAKPTQLASLGASLLPPIHLGTAPILGTAAPAQVAQGDSAGAAPAVFTPKPANTGAVKRWAVQIGVFASETLAQAQLAAFAKRGVDVIGQAEKLVIPFPAVGGHTLYRARFGLFAEDEARSICKRMTRRGQTCFAAPAGDDAGRG
jgi:D-alanyl-D-alanine carboxypeptidase